MIDEFRDPRKGSAIAYRGRFRWEREFRNQRLPAGGPERLKPRGVYLITGGTGGLGLALAKHLAQFCQARLVLTKKNALPAADESIAAALREIVSCGGTAEVVVCDAADRPAMQNVVAQIRAKHGRIDGAIHAAGILRDGLIQLKTPAGAESVMAPKVAGAAVLYDVLKGFDLDFLVLFSSLSSVIPFHGQSDYCAANAFLDAFAAAAGPEGRFPVLAINWPVWREVGLAARLQALPGLPGLQTQDGLEAFHRALNSGLTQVIVSPVDPKRVEAESNRPPAVAPARIPAERAAPGPGPRDEAEAAIAQIWSRVLGAGPIGIHQNFLEIGGHSLLAMQIVSQIRSLYQVDFTLRKFFEVPTIEGNAAAIQAEIIAEIENLSDDQPSRRVS